MKILFYNELNPKGIPNFRKLKGFLEADDFHSAEVKKVGDDLYRAKLDKSNRLLFSLRVYQGQTYALILECIPNHAYEKSRFLKGNAPIDENKIPAIEALDKEQTRPLVYINPDLPTFNLLDKIISFDEIQADVYRLHPPLIIIGSAGSGKTALTLEKMKEWPGDILYVTRSPYLVHNSRNLYFSQGYENEDQNIDFFSFQEYLESIQVPKGQDLSYREFAIWHGRQRLGKALRDSHQLFEEFRGVLTGADTHSDSPYLSREEYLALGIKQSLFFGQEREQVYEAFGRYLAYMDENDRYDANILSHQYMAKVEPQYDFLVVDEVQDLTNIQIQLILKSLRQPHGFLLCGDSNQIVHPNFFSWSKLKSYFYRQEGQGAPAELIRILNTNYRNSVEVTEVANRILKIKNARFGSVDKESNYLVHSNSEHQGVAVLLPDDEAIKREIDTKTRTSTRFAVIVMHPDQKGPAKNHFRTPLIFSIQEAKGLEYENIILYNLASADETRFREITQGVNQEDLIAEELTFARGRDKSDKSLEIYKFYINSLYVAITRAVKNIYLIETRPEQRLFDLLGLQVARDRLELGKYGSSLEEWRAEAHKLELQGKQEQADEIRTQILKQKPVPWQVLQGDTLAKLDKQALAEGNRKAKLSLFEYALVYGDQNRLNALMENKFDPARNPGKGIKALEKKHYMPYTLKHPGAALRQCDLYGTDFRDLFNQTPLMIASRLGNAMLVDALMERDADTEKVDNVGFNAFLIALAEACKDQKYATGKLPAIFQKIRPDSISIQVDGKLIKLDNHLMEFLMLCLTMVFFYTRLGEKLIKGHAIESGDFVQMLAGFPNRLVPERRKKRPYISSILSKNERDRDDRYNRKIFWRTKRGHYLINPKLSVRVEGQWRNIYDLLSLDMISVQYKGFSMKRSKRAIEEHFRKFRDELREMAQTPAE
uniref:Superfamily I DNA or RNA helicase n=1 Tax=Candidatus Kentrum sp. FM TaxID=2126340 RepID=A0A450SVL6_9GAMM|nr:MAG: Superfamily I DNA or RNA helicase [Candidatus Kentron sp. FM]VFJ67026.1 MAG: Superfamily I DNA or RNA helicase [Candidatus Kentron sp. FM]VFK08198.1 MAG: Superfamily I DNA or RNA helicase [Candidatus Kentron sp. FM]